MSTLSDHEAGRVPDRGRPVLLRLLRYARPYTALIALTFVLSGVYGAASYGRAYLIKPALDDVVLPSHVLGAEFGPGGELPGPLALLGAGPPGEDAAPADDDVAARRRAEILESLWQIIGLAALVVLAMPAAMFAREYAVQHVLGRVDLDMKVEICGKLLALPLRFHQDRRRGDVLGRIMGDVGMAHGALTLLFGDFLEAVLMVVVGAGALLFVSWRLALVMLLVGPIVFGVISLFGNRIRKSARRRQEEFAGVTQRLLEILAGIKVIKAFRAERLENEAFEDAAHRLFRRGMKVVKNRVLARSLVDMMNNAVGVGVLVFGILLTIGGRFGLTMGDLAAFAAITTILYKPVKTLARGWVRLMDAEPSAVRFFEVIDEPVEIRDASHAVRIEGVRQGIALRDLSFSYGQELVLHGISFEVEAGEMVAIVGRTGAGKSTLIDLLLRFHDPVEGSIEIDGIDLREIERDSLLDHVAVVSQEPFLFDGTIGDNIRYGRPDATEAEVLAAARAAHVDEFAESLRDRYDTRVGAAGARLSGGQRQRITIARAVLRDPAILLLDEATSSLDAKSERFVQEALEKLLAGRTVFVIAHRLSTVRRANKIVVLEKGRVTEVGTHEGLLAAGGLYSELVELQFQRPGSPPPLATGPNVSR